MTRHYFQHISGTLFCLALAVAAAGLLGRQKNDGIHCPNAAAGGRRHGNRTGKRALAIHLYGADHGYLSATVSAQVGGILKQRTYKEGRLRRQRPGSV